MFRPILPIPALAFLFAAAVIAVGLWASTWTGLPPAMVVKIEIAFDYVAEYSLVALYALLGLFGFLIAALVVAIVFGIIRQAIYAKRGASPDNPQLKNSMKGKTHA